MPRRRRIRGEAVARRWDNRCRPRCPPSPSFRRDPWNSEAAAPASGRNHEGRRRLETERPNKVAAPSHTNMNAEWQRRPIAGTQPRGPSFPGVPKPKADPRLGRLIVFLGRVPGKQASPWRLSIHPELIFRPGLFKSLCSAITTFPTRRRSLLLSLPSWPADSLAQERTAACLGCRKPSPPGRCSTAVIPSLRRRRPRGGSPLQPKEE